MRWKHIANPIKALYEWKRVIKDKANRLLVVPHKEGTYDHKRPITGMAHLIEDYDGNTGEDDQTHFDEMIELTDYSKNKKISNSALMKECVKVNHSVRGMHHHVFNTELVLKLCDYVALKILSVYHVSPFHIIVLCQKLEESTKLNNECFLSPQATRRVKSLFVLDRKL